MDQDNQDIGFEEFMGAFGEDVGNQTEQTNGSAEREHPADDIGEDSNESPADTGSDNVDGEDGQQSANEDGNQTGGNAEEKSDGETFTLKVNKEEKTYSREEVISLAQKGADYDRVKEQLAQSRKAEEQLQQQLLEQKDTLEVLEQIASEAEKEIPQLLTELRHNLWRKQGLSDDAINERELRMKAEKENAQLKAQPAQQEQPEETSQQRAKRDLEAFRKEYPDVQLTDELLKNLAADIQGGGSLISAYQKYEAAQKDAKIAQLEKALAAEKKNKENRTSSPGSQRDSGGRREKSEFDDFMEAFR